LPTLAAVRIDVLFKYASVVPKKVPPSVFFGTNRNWASVAWGFYGSFLTSTQLRLNPEKQPENVPVYAFGYDWRQSNLTSGAQLKQYISKVLALHPSANRVICVTHSMGGLVFRSMRQLDAAWVDSAVKSVVHVAQPSIGAPVAYVRYANGVEPGGRAIDVLTGNPADFFLSMALGSEITGTSAAKGRAKAALKKAIFGPGFLGWGMGKAISELTITPSPTNYQALLGTLPGPNELLPAPSYNLPRAYSGWIRVDGAAVANPSDAYGGKPLNPYLEIPAPARTAAAAFHSVVTDLVVHPKTYVISGTGHSTMVRTEFRAGSMPVAGPTFDTAGDGTVPEHSGNCATLGAGLTRFAPYPADHSGIFDVVDVAKKLRSILRAEAGFSP